MAITAIDPVSALVVVDLQRGITASPAAHSVPDIIRRARSLADEFRTQRLPVILVTVDGTAPGRRERASSIGALPPDYAELVPELGADPTDIRITKRTWNAFANTDLEPLLRDRDVTGIVLCGISTSAGVESTARSAYERGFNVTLAIDAMTDGNADAHANSIERIFPRLGETGTVADIIAHLRNR